MTVVGWSPSEAHKAFVPHLSQRALKRALRTGALVTYRISSQRIVLTRDLEKWVASQPIYNKRTRHAPEE